MLFKTQSAAVYGIDAYLVEVEVDVGSARMQDFNVVGLPDNAVKESRERIKSALRNCGFEFPYGQGVTINLAPADIRKEGSAFDLPMALGLAGCMGQFFGKVLDKYIRETIVRDQLARAVHLKPLIYILGHEDRSNLGAIEGWDTIAVQKVQINQADMVGRFARTKDREVIVQLEDTDFLRLTFSTLDESVQQKIINLFIELSRGMDIVEPLERVENALRNLCQESQESNSVKH